jgi:biopolymer transport protein ExbD
MKKRTREQLGMDLTPMIDVVFQLLIFFMVSSAFRRDELALLLSLPKAQNAQDKGAGQEKKIMMIELTDLDLAIDAVKMTIEEADAKFSALQDRAIPVDMRVDKQVRYERLVKILDLLRKHQLSNLSLITEK